MWLPEARAGGGEEWGGASHRGQCQLDGGISF